MFKSLLMKWCERVPKKNYDLTDIKSIIIRPFFRLGDCVIHTACFVQLKKYFPNIKIGVLATDYNRCVFECCPVVDEIIPYKYMSLFKQRKKWQVLLDFPGRFTSFSLIFDKILSPDYVICFQKEFKKTYNENTVHNYDIYCKKIPGLHFSRWLRMTPLDFVVNEPIEYCLMGFQPQDNPYEFNSSDKVRILLCIEGSNRYLPIPFVIKLLSELNRPEYEFILLHTDHSDQYYDELKNIDGLNLFHLPKTNFKNFLKFVYFSDAVITLDTATVHIANAYKKPIISLYANFSDNLELVCPLEYEDSTLITPLEINDNQREYSSLKVEDVYPKAENLLKKIKNKKYGN